MKVDGRTKNSWILKLKKTSVTNIAKGAGLSRFTVGQAINHGIASRETIEKINKFFQELENHNTIPA